MKRILSILLIMTLAFGGSLLPIGEAYAASQPVVIEHSDGISIVQNADGSKTLTWYGGGDSESAADPTQLEEWTDLGESWSNSGEVAETKLRKTYEKNKPLVTLRKDGTSISFTPIQNEVDVAQPQTEVAPSRQISDNQTASNVLRIGPSPKGRPTSVQGRIRRGGRSSRGADGMPNVAPAVYEGLFDAHSDVHVTALAGGFKEDIVVHAYTGNHKYAYQVTVSGMSLRQQGQRIELVQDDEVIGLIERDRYGVRRAGAHRQYHRCAGRQDHLCIRRDRQSGDGHRRAGGGISLPIRRGGQPDRHDRPAGPYGQPGVQQAGPGYQAHAKERRRGEQPVRQGRAAREGDRSAWGGDLLPL